jgi:hypothetical protein
MPGAMDVDRRKRFPAFPSLYIGIAAHEYVILSKYYQNRFNLV